MKVRALVIRAGVWPILAAAQLSCGGAPTAAPAAVPYVLADPVTVRERRYLYASTLHEDFDAMPYVSTHEITPFVYFGTETGITAFRIDPETGDLRPLAGSPFGRGPVWSVVLLTALDLSR